MEKSDTEWKAELTDEQYDVLRNAGTEAPFSGKYVGEKRDGTYHCAGCGAALFSSDTKFDSGTGWPSFDEVMNDDSVVTVEDESHGMRRVEVRCAECNGHLGHVFDDGPTSSGKRYCINSAALCHSDDMKKE